MIVTPPPIATLSRLKRRHTCSQYPRASTLVSAPPQSSAGSAPDSRSRSIMLIAE